ncbi:amino acid adenylation domain-containing protein [Streptosporangium sp. NPDC000396]|uniref:non-ribosomal peptide synthetase n=1 Tax=Streptosporangium sp. NPDC000396 TaxID=3366185 RepID=UPI003686E2AD
MKSDSDIGRALARHAEEEPDRPAVVSATGMLTYRDLALRVDRYRGALVSAGLRPGDVVAMTMADGADATAALLAAFVAGTPFVWLDGDQPAVRHRAIVDDCRPRGIVTTPEGAAMAADLTRSPAVVVVAGDEATVFSGASGEAGSEVPADTSCLVYTSGSTGAPKGIVQRSGNLMHFASWFAGEVGLAPGARMLQWARPSYDAAYVEILGAVHAGATLVVPPPEVKPDGVRMREWVATHEVSHVFTVPTLFRRLLNARDEASAAPAGHMRSVTLFGEPLHGSLVGSVRRHFPGTVVYNMYGPTESTVATFYRVPDDYDGAVPIGTDIPGIEILLRDAQGAPVADGEEGEICIRSRYLAHGYLRRQKETDEVFLPDDGDPATRLDGDGPAPRIYRTGDLGRRLPDGTLTFAGRRDGQVKIRGARVELGEIESVLLSDPAVAQAAVGVFGDETGTTHPAAYLEPHQGGSVDVKVLHRRLAGTLPAYMVPAAYVVLEKLPLTSTGKVDRQRLPDPRSLSKPAGPAQEPAAFTTETEKKLADIWCEVLNRDHVDPEDDFFALDGHSMLAVRITAAVAEVFEVEIPVRAVFEFPTVRELAAYVDTERDALPS